MKGGNTQVVMDMAVQYGYIAEADQPFRVGPEPAPVDTVNDPDRTITPTSAKYSPVGRIIKHLLQIGQPFFIRSAKGEILPANGCAKFGPVSPGVYQAEGRFHFFHRNTA